jgi:hypothetical protein
MDSWRFIDDILTKDNNTVTEENAELIFQFVRSYPGPFTKEKFIQLNTMSGDKRIGKFLHAVDICLQKWLGEPAPPPTPTQHSIKDPAQALRMLQADTNTAYYIDPSIFTEEMIRIMLDGPEANRVYLTPESNPSLYRRMVPTFLQYPNICEQVDITPFLTDEQIIGLGYKQEPSTFYQRLRDAIGDDQRICLHALCHGGPTQPFSPDVKITRFSSVPLGVCEYMRKKEEVKMHRVTRFDTFEASTVETILRLRERDLGEGDEKAKRAEALKLVKRIKKVYLPPPPRVAGKIDLTEDDEIMNKIFSMDGERVLFLDIVTRRGTFNLFSIGDGWTLGGIIDLLKALLGRNNFEIVMGDYSCSKDETTHPDVLAYAGKRIRNKRTRKRFIRKTYKRSFFV